MSDDPYVYPGTNVLQNKFGIKDASRLDSVEREFVLQRLEEGPPSGDFDLHHLKLIHYHLFQDVYAWAGELRTLDISKGGNAFQPFKFIETGIGDIHGRLEKQNFLVDLTPPSFAADAARIIGDLNYVHPFREGNGRTQLEYLRQLSDHAGHPLNLRLLDPDRWIAASRAAHETDYNPMAAEIANVIGMEQGRVR